MVKSFRGHFLKNNPDWGHFIKENYEFAPFCNSRFSSANVNMLARIQNAFATGLSSEKKGKLPDYVIIVLDEDLISFLEFEKEGLATLLGSWVEWLANEIDMLLQQRKDQIPKKCWKDVFFYWVHAPNHSSFSKCKNGSRTKFNLSLESVIRTYKNMRVIKLKDKWDPRDGSLVVNNRITEPGLSAYWNAIDCAFKYNVQRREIYLAKQMAQKHSDIAAVQARPADSKSEESRVDPMFNFFRKHQSSKRVGYSEFRQEEMRRFNVENDMHSQEDRSRPYCDGRSDRFRHSGRERNRFMLPRLSNYRR